MNRLLGVLLALGAATAAAEPPPDVAEQLGRLFTTPEQRRLLDRSRAETAAPATPPPAPAPPRTREARPRETRLDGIVLRGERPVACWLDGAWQPEGDKCPRRP